jgi:hypothetical protein
MANTFVFYVCSYLLVFFLSHKTMQILSENSAHLTEKTKDMQRQLARALLVQSITPAVTSGLPIILLVFCLVLALDSGCNCL